MSFAGKRILVVEDDGLLAMELDLVLGDNGAVVVGPTHTVAESLAILADNAVDAAVLDVNLGSESSEPVADRLSETGTPFLYLSGHDAKRLPERHRERPLVSKPFLEHELLGTLTELLGG